MAISIPGNGNTIVQVKQTVLNTGWTATGPTTPGTPITGLSVSITPFNANNKILVTYNVNGSCANDGVLFLLRNGSLITGAIGTGSSNCNATSSIGPRGTTYEAFCSTMTYLDSPNTTASTTYSINAGSQGGGQAFYVNRTPATATDEVYISTITVMEIAGY